eukprot:TRINITY_DN1888_c0_g1_i6.p1 TRINITY_DN1888_c0_g1~~TRINITY_DN1888_c0_g1_i6.p1  ORF type:complete len:176 (-),score=33.47 TRINITY_DN1888_c0_g1_i6:111-638(-)
MMLPRTKPVRWGLTLRSIHVEKTLQEKGFSLPPPNRPAGNYVGCQRSGNTLYISGHLPWQVGHEYKGTEYLITGKVGDQLTTEQAYEAAKSVALALIGTLKGEVGDLDKVKIIKLNGYVNCVDGFNDQPKVLNGASDFLVSVFGEKGKHARSAVGTNSLPLNVPVEIEMVAEILE